MVLRKVAIREDCDKPLLSLSATRRQRGHEPSRHVEIVHATGTSHAVCVATSRDTRKLRQVAAVQMTARTLIKRSLRFHWRSHLGVVLGAAIGSAALIGALVVGDSVRESLRERALERLGKIQIALDSGDRFFLDRLGWRLPGGFRDAWREDDIFTYFPEYPAAVLQLPGIVAKQSGSARANHVNV